jgi:hypothetical protein
MHQPEARFRPIILNQKILHFSIKVNLRGTSKNKNSQASNLLKERAKCPKTNFYSVKKIRK